MRGGWIAIALGLALFSGCLERTVVVTTTVDYVDQRFVPGEFPSGTGGLAGITINENGAAVPSVHLTILDQPYYVQSDAKGHFNFLGAIPAGTYLLRWDHPDYRSSQKAVRVLENEAAHTEVVLAAPGGLTGDHIAHQHDLWGEKKELPLFNGVVSLPAGPIESKDTAKPYANCAFFVSSGTCHTATFNLPQPKIVPPGTVELKATISWNPRDVVTQVTFLYTPADQTYPRDVKEVKSGDTIKIPVTLKNTDHGHASRSQWSFGIVMKVINQGMGLHTEPTNMVLSPEATIVLTAIRGNEELPPEPPHLRYWKDGPNIVLLKDRNGVNTTGTREAAAPTSAASCASYSQMCRVISLKPKLNPGNVTIVPPGTTRLSLTFEWGVGGSQVPASPKDKTLLVRTPTVDAAKATWADYVTPSVLKTEGRKTMYELKLKPEEVDPYYQKKSGFVFAFAKVGEEAERTYVSDCPQVALAVPCGDWFDLTVVAINDNWTPELAAEPNEED